MVNVLLFLQNKPRVKVMSNFIIDIYRFFTDKKFELDHLGELSLYTYDELCIELKNFDKRVKFQGNAMLVTWESIHTILVIKYNFDGEFIEKVLEKWK